MRRIALLSLLAVVAPPAARADIGVIRVAPRAAHPGTVVHITAGGYVGNRPEAFPIVMLPAASAPRPYSCFRGSAVCTPAVFRSAIDEPPFIRVATLRRARGRFALRVPHVRPGRYVFALFCERCTGGPKGSLIVADRMALRVL